MIMLKKRTRSNLNLDFSKAHLSNIVDKLTSIKMLQVSIYSYIVYLHQEK